MLLTLWTPLPRKLNDQLTQLAAADAAVQTTTIYCDVRQVEEISALNQVVTWLLFIMDIIKAKKERPKLWDTLIDSWFFATEAYKPTLVRSSHLLG